MTFRHSGGGGKRGGLGGYPEFEIYSVVRMSCWNYNLSFCLWVSHNNNKFPKKKGQHKIFNNSHGGFFLCYPLTSYMQKTNRKEKRKKFGLATAFLERKINDQQVFWAKGKFLFFLCVNARMVTTVLD